MYGKNKQAQQACLATAAVAEAAARQSEATARTKAATAAAARTPTATGFALSAREEIKNQVWILIRLLSTSRSVSI